MGYAGKLKVELYKHGETKWQEEIYFDFLFPFNPFINPINRGSARQKSFCQRMFAGSLLHVLYQRG